MNKELEIRESILNKAEELFVQYGFKRVTMDDIARELSISKKTIYQFFKDKNEIVCSATQQHMEKECCQIEELERVSENVIELLVGLSKHIRTHLYKVNPSVLLDLQRHYPQGWKIFMKYKEGTMKQQLVNLLERGKKEGYFREDINSEILAVMRFEQMQSTFDGRLYPPAKYDFREVQIQLLNHFIAGIITPKGRELLENYTKSDIHNEIKI